MRKYELYIIDQLFAQYYYGRERMFYQLFKDFKESPANLKEILLKQIDYITRPIPGVKMHTFVLQKLQSKDEFYSARGEYYINELNGSSKLVIDNRRIIIETEGTINGGICFLETLRKCEYNFFAVDIKSEQYGWLKPLKEKSISIKKFKKEMNTVEK